MGELAKRRDGEKQDASRFGGKNLVLFILSSGSLITKKDSGQVGMTDKFDSDSGGRLIPPEYLMDLKGNVLKLKRF
jgi:hypothetical protein